MRRVPLDPSLSRVDGELSLNDFDVIKEIGAGATSKVYLARSKLGGRAVAFKELRSPLSKNSHRSFVREIMALAKFAEPTLLQCFGYIPITYDERSGPYIVTEYCLYGSVDKCAYNPPEWWNSTRKMIVSYGIACGLLALHDQHFLHRDVKPANIVLNENREPKIGDFGLARLMPVNGDELTRGVGTCCFMAPEVEDGSYGPPADVFSFGQCLYVIWTGQRAKNIFKNQGPDIPEDVPKAIRVLITECLMWDPSARPTMKGIVDRLVSDEFVADFDASFEGGEFQTYVEKISCQSPGRKDGMSEFYQGMRWLKGVDGPQDVGLAMHHFRSSAECGNRNAMMYYAWLLMNELREYDQAIDWLVRAAQGGHGRDNFRLADDLRRVAATEGAREVMSRYSEILTPSDEDLVKTAQKLAGKPTPQAAIAQSQQPRDPESADAGHTEAIQTKAANSSPKHLYLQPTPYFILAVIFICWGLLS